MNSQITISDIRFKKCGEINPLIVDFQNGDIIDENVDGLKAKLIPRDGIDGKLLEVLSKEGQKFVNAAICPSMSNKFVAIRNRKTNKVKLIQVDFTALINFLHLNHGEKQEEKISTEQQMKTLKRTFGTKKAVRALEQNEILNVTKSQPIIEGQISEILNDSQVTETSSIFNNEDDSKTNLLPPCNRDAEKVEQVYQIGDCLSDEELSLLLDAVNDILENGNNALKSNDFLETYLQQVLDSGGNQEIKLSCLLYASALLTYIKTPAKSLSKVAPSLCPYSKIISDKIIREFAIKTGRIIHKPLAMKDKAICYIIVLLIIACDFKLDLEPLARLSACGFKKMKQLARLVGLVPATKSSNVHVLTLPLPPPLKMIKEYKKKK